MNRSRRGAAQVSVVWVVTVGFLFLAALLFAFNAHQKAQASAQEAVKAKADAVAALTRDEDSAKQAREVSKYVGWYDPATEANKLTDVNVLKTDFEDFKAAFGTDMGADVSTIAAALPIAKQAYQQRVKDIATLNDTKTTLENENRTMKQGLTDALNQKTTELANLQKQLADDTNTATQTKAELEGRIASLNTQRSELDAQLREARGAGEKASRAFDQERQTFETREKATRAKLAFTQEPTSPDGKVLEVSKDLALGWINIGSNSRVQRGMRFHIVSGKTGSTTIKGMAEVTNVKPDMAEVSFYDINDRFDPIVASDTIYNPLFDPKGERNAVLAGRFSGQFNEAELKVLLANMNIKVQPELAFDTDYLIVGSEVYVDDQGQPLDEPLKPSELAVYKNAEAKGVNIVSINQLRTYFKF